MNDSLFCTVSMNLKKHRMSLLETVIITDGKKEITGMKVLMRMLNKDTLFNSSTEMSDVIIVNYDFDDLELFTFKNVEESYIISKDQKYIKKYAKLVKNTEMPVEMLVDQYINGVLPAFLEENEIKIEYLSPIVIERALHDYIEKFRLQTMYRQN
jgi:hypothetical protein